MLSSGMERDTVLNRLRERRAELQARGVRHAALFGSLARGDAGPVSDTPLALTNWSAR